MGPNTIFGGFTNTIRTVLLISNKTVQVRIELAETETRNSAIAEIARVGGHYAVEDHSRSLMLVSTESPYATHY